MKLFEERIYGAIFAWRFQDPTFVLFLFVFTLWARHVRPYCSVVLFNFERSQQCIDAWFLSFWDSAIFVLSKITPPTHGTSSIYFMGPGSQVRFLPLSSCFFVCQLTFYGWNSVRENTRGTPLVSPFIYCILENEKSILWKVCCH